MPGRRQQCTAHKKSDKSQCRNWARNGYTVCRFHGAGGKATPGGRPPTIGRYSQIKREALRDLIAEHAQAPDPLNLYAELAFLRALVQDFVDRYDTWSAALLSWHASFTWEPSDGEDGPPVADKPHTILDIADAYRILAEIGRMVERIDTMQKGASLTARDVMRLMEQMALVVELHVEDVGVKEKIRDAWQRLIAS